MSQRQQNYHGVLISINNKGILIIGDAGIGKSSLALELLYQGHQLIADDSVEISATNKQIIGKCPPLLADKLHTRELGLISVSHVFGDQAWQVQHTIDYVLKLQSGVDNESSLSLLNKQYCLLDKTLPFLTLNTYNPASLVSRLLCWIRMQPKQHLLAQEFSQCQRTIMTSL